MKINIQRTGSIEVPIPKYQTEGSAGFDLYAAIKEPIILYRHCLGDQIKNWVLIPTGLIFEIPQGYEGQIRPRSGLALKNGISIVNSPGTIDQDYRGPVGVILINHGIDAFTINPLDRIAQMIISPVIQVEFDLVDGLSETARGAGGFGSTGFIKHGDVVTGDEKFHK
jgi:dUTP pyrophosphatase